MPALTIYPYRLENECWVFDDQVAGLKEEAFVQGMTEMISRIVEFKEIAHASQGFALSFAAEPFDHDVELAWITPEEAAKARNCKPTDLVSVGNWYRGAVAGQPMVGWLCPALFLYFSEAPKKIFVRANPLPAGLDPIWHVAPGDSRAMRFVAAPRKDGGNP